MASKNNQPGKRTDMFRVDPNEVVIIGLDTKHKSKAEHPLYDDRIKLKITEPEVKNVMLFGVKQNIILHKEEIDGKDVFVVVAGRQRVRMAREANKQLKKLGEPLVEVPATTERKSHEILSLYNLATNAVRKDDDIEEKGKIARDMLASDRFDMAKVAATFGVTEAAVQQWVDYGDAPKELRQAAREGVISQTAALELSRLPAEEAKEALKEMKSTGQTTVRAAKSQRAKRGAGKNGKGAKANAAEVSTHPSIPKRKIQNFVIYASRLQKDGGAATEDMEAGLDALIQGGGTYLDLFMLGMRVACGDRSTSTVKGFNALMDEATGK